MIVLVAVLATGAVGAAAGTALGWWWFGHHGADAMPRPERVRHVLRHHRHLDSVLRRDVDPAIATALVLATVFVVLAVMAVAMGLILLAATTDEVGVRADGPLAQWAADRATADATAIIGDLSELGGTLAVVVVATVVCIIELRRTPTWGIPVLLVVVVGGQFALVYAIKALVDRARPELLQLTGFAGASFPSGHASAAAATFAVAALLLGRRRSRATRAVLTGIAVGVALMVAATRVALGVHWTTDVVAGLILGWGWTLVGALAVGGTRLHFGEPVARVQELAADQR